jgi:glycopeptide antibiotics resistance protein
VFPTQVAGPDAARSGLGFPSRGTWALLGAAFLLFAAYASLVPFDLRPVSVDSAVRAFREVVAHPLRLRFSRTDLVANVLLFVPIGFCLAGALRLGSTRWWSGPVAAIVVLSISIPWSLAIEFAQLFTAGRITSIGDVAAQTFGTMAGLVLWETVGADLSAWLRSTMAARSRTERIERVLATYVVLWAFVNLAPFDLTLDLGTLATKFRRGGIQLIPVPFARPSGAVGPWLWDIVSTGLAALPVGAYAVLGRTVGLRRRHWLRAAQLSLAAILLLELTQVFVASHVADVNDFLAGCAGAWGGIWLAWHFSARPAGTSPLASIRTVSWPAVGALAAWCLVLAAYHWMPYDFSTDITMIRRKLAAMSLIPFAGYHVGPDLNALNQLLVKTSLSLPLGLIAGFVLRVPPGSTAARLASAGALLFAAAVLSCIEAGQLLLPSRYADPTDVLVGVAAAAAGLLATRWVRRGH